MKLKKITSGGKSTKKKSAASPGSKTPKKKTVKKSTVTSALPKPGVKTKKAAVKAVTRKMKEKLPDESASAIQKLVHLLQVHQVELEHQNQELRIAQAELEASRNQYVNLFDFSPVPYLSLDMSGRITAVNLIAGKMLGWDRKVLIGKQFLSFIPMSNRQTFSLLLKNIFTSSKKATCEVNILNKDKRVFRVRVDGIEVNDVLQTQRSCLIAVIDLDDYK